MALMISYLITIWLTSRYKDKVHKELLDKHDEETANRLTEQFNIEVEKLKKEIVELKKELNITKEEAESRFREGVIGMQIIGKHFDEQTIYRVANAFEQAHKEMK